MTASTVAGALGLNPHMSPLNAWERITHPRRQASLEKPDSRASEGYLVEKLLCPELFKARRKCDLNTSSTLLLDDWAAATPDYVISPNIGLVECKGVGSERRNEWGYLETESDSVPEYVRIQVFFQAIVFEASNGMPAGTLELHVFAYFGFGDWKIYTINRDIELEDALMRASRRFWMEHVSTEIPPDEGSTSEFLSVFNRRFKAREGVVELTDCLDHQEPTELMRDYFRLGTDLKRLQEARDEVKKTLAHHLEALNARGFNLNGEGSFGLSPHRHTAWEEIVREMGTDEETIRKYTRLSTVLRGLPHRKRKL